MADKDIELQIAELKKKIAELEKEKSIQKKAGKAKDAKGKRKVGQGSRKVSDRLNIKLKQEVTPKYKMIDDIKKSPLYGKTNRDEPARQYITEHAKVQPKNAINPGQLIMFKYFTPKHEEELEYYDAAPCTIFFGTFNSKEGKRVLGFNIHYYPPKMRYQIMDKIFELYRPVYTKYFAEGNRKEIDAFDYQMLVKQLQRANLAFGVREYIPSLIGEPVMVPANMWQVAVFTEGWFKKKTRQQIMKFWEKWLNGTKRNKPSSDDTKHPKYKSRGKK